MDSPNIFFPGFMLSIRFSRDAAQMIVTPYKPEACNQLKNPLCYASFFPLCYLFQECRVYRNFQYIPCAFVVADFAYLKLISCLSFCHLVIAFFINLIFSNFFTNTVLSTPHYCKFSLVKLAIDNILNMGDNLHRIYPLPFKFSFYNTLRTLIGILVLYLQWITQSSHLSNLCCHILLNQFTFICCEILIRYLPIWVATTPIIL